MSWESIKAPSYFPRRSERLHRDRREHSVAEFRRYFGLLGIRHMYICVPGKRLRYLKGKSGSASSPAPMQQKNLFQPTAIRLNPGRSSQVTSSERTHCARWNANGNCVGRYIFGHYSIRSHRRSAADLDPLEHDHSRR